MGKKKVAKELGKKDLGSVVDAGLENTECGNDVVDYVVQDKKKKRGEQLDGGGSEHFASDNKHQKEDKRHNAVDMKEDRRKNNKKKKLEKEDEDEAERKKRRKKGDRVSGDEVVSESPKADLENRNLDVNPLDKTDVGSFRENRKEKHEKHKKCKHREEIDAILLPGENFGDSQTSEFDETNKDERKKKKKKTTKGEQNSTDVSKVNEDKTDVDSFGENREEKRKKHKKRKHREEEIDAIPLPGEKFGDRQTNELDETYKDERKKKKKKKTEGERNSTDVSKINDDRMSLDDARLENSSKKKERKREKKKESKGRNNIGTGEEGDRGKATKMSKKVKMRNTKVATSEQYVEDSQHSRLQSNKKKSKRVSFADHVEVFTSADSLSELNADDGEKLIRGKRFSEEEDELVKKAVYDFIEAKELGENGLEMVLHCKNYPEIKKTCWKEIAASLPWRPLASIYHRAHVLFERAEERTWTAEEYNFVKKFYEEHGADWRKLGDALGKHRFHVKDAWRRIKVANLKKGQWSQEEYQALFDLVNMDIGMKAFEEKKSKHGMLRDNIAWTAISDKMATRRVSACCDKWYKQLSSPMVVEGKWADADDYRLLNALLNLDAFSMEDVDWDNLTEGRSGDLCRKRWNQMVRHIGDYGSKSFAEQVELLSRRYSPDVLESREAFDNRPVVP